MIMPSSHSSTSHILRTLRYLLISGVAVLVQTGHAQARFEQEFEAFSQNQQRQYRNFTDASDAAFSEWLNQAWQAYRRFSPHQRELGPKIPRQPIAPGSHRPDSFTRADDKPVVSPSPDRKSATLDAQFDFFGHGVTTVPWPDPLPPLPTLTPGAIASAWRTLSGADYLPVLSSLRYTCEELRCGDWARILLVRHYGAWMAGDTGATPSQRKLMEWFLLDKLGYRVRGGRLMGSDSGKPRLAVLYNPRQRVYGTPYFSVAGEEYFPTEPLPEGKLYTYPDGFAPEASYHRQAVDLGFERTLSVQGNTALRTLIWPGERKRRVTLRYSAARRLYLDQHPQVDLHWYFSAPLDPVLSASIGRELSVSLGDLTPLEQAGQLLRFVQFAVPYEIDATQFGRENYLLPEQLLYYPAADCEDRSLFFIALIDTLLDLPVLGVRYPGHVAAAIALPAGSTTEATATTFAHGERVFLMADPSYRGAGIGELMTDLQGEPEELIIPSRM